MSLLAATLLLGQVTGLAPRLESSELTMSDRTEFRVRAVPSADPAYDATTSVAAGISVLAPRVSYSVGYSLTFTAADLELSPIPPPAVMQGGRVGISYARHRWTLTLSLAGSYGTSVAIGVAAPVRLDVPGPGVGTPAGMQPTGPGAPLPTYVAPTQELKTGTLGGNVGVGYALSRRWSLSISGTGGASGGIDFLSQRVAPPSRSAGGSVGFGYKLTRFDQLATRISSSYIFVLQLPKLESPKFTLTNPPGGWTVSTDLYETWNHTLSKRTATSLGAGVSVVHAEAAETAAADNVFAIGNASISDVAPLPGHAKLGTAATVAVTTTYNPVVAQVQHQGSVSATASWSWRKWSVAVLAGGASQLPVYARYSSRVATGSISVGYAPADAVLLQAGVSGNTQVLYDNFLGLPPPPDWAAFVALQLIAPRLRL